MAEAKIPGVDMVSGLDLYGGEMDIYTTVLESFAANTPAAIDKLRNVTSENLPNYAITIHGIKSVSATIAANNISEKAKKLEMLAKAGDLAGVLAENDKLISDLEILVNDVKNWLKASS